MATERERPYSQFNYRVSWDGLDENSFQAGFQEVSGLGLEITVQEYRAGNFSENAPIKITGLSKVPDVTFKRGLIGALDLYAWLNEVRNGSQEQLRTVNVKLMSEDRNTVAQEWKLTAARPMKYTGPTLNGTATEVAVEELVLAAERIDVA
jgi:phage tail-like protein